MKKYIILIIGILIVLGVVGIGSIKKTVRNKCQSIQNQYLSECGYYPGVSECHFKAPWYYEKVCPSLVGVPI